MKILIEEGDVLNRVLSSVTDGDASFYEGPKVQAAAQAGRLVAYFSELDDEMHLVLSLDEEPIKEDPAEEDEC